MKTNIFLTTFFILLCTCLLSMDAQDDLFSAPESSFERNGFYKLSDKVMIADFKSIIGTETSVPLINIKSIEPVTLRIRIYAMDGSLIKEEETLLATGDNEINVDMPVALGVYMVQFYTKDGSILRRFVRSNEALNL